ncbi:MAG TPA: ATP-binding protein [Opitutaceae bacterium]|nr:ATP-binding protein [Opitutaceae bacterium]
MLLSTALCAAVGALAVGTSALWSNPKRTLNCVLAGASAYLAIWLATTHASLWSEENFLWLRLSWIIAGFFPVVLSWIREVLIGPLPVGARLKAVGGWWAFPVIYLLAAVRANFVTAGRDGLPVYGWSYPALLAIGGVGAALFAMSTLFKLREQKGARRLDLQLLAIGGGGSIAMAHLLPAIALLTHDTTWERLTPLSVLAFFGAMTWSLVTVRLSDAKHLVSIGLEKLVLVAGVSAFVWGVQQLAAQFIPEWLALGVSMALGLWFVAEVRPWLVEASQRKAAAERMRRAAFEVARKELRPEQLENEYCKLLQSWAHADRAVILMASQGRLVGGGMEWPLDQAELRLLHAMRWATPERIERERERADGGALSRLMKNAGFGVMVASGGPALSFVIALSVPRSERPYTFSQITLLIALQATIESSLSRAHYLMKAQHADQLATVGLLGASIAHEIRNPLVSIKTFVQLLPDHFQDPTFREKFFRLIGDEVGRIDRLTEQLLDLSAPRVFTMQATAIHLLLSGCLDLIAAKADDKGVQIVRDFQAQNDVVYTDPNAVKQVVLNLGFNAIQALEQHAGDRNLRLSTRQLPSAVELTVTDSGPGISADVWSRLFQPFQSTKSSGFGLGLAICKDILSSLHASITADPPVPGRGATFRIVLPCQPPTS